MFKETHREANLRLRLTGICLLTIVFVSAWSMQSASLADDKPAVVNQEASDKPVAKYTSRYQVEKLEWVADGRRLFFGGFKGRDDVEDGRGDQGGEQHAAGRLHRHPTPWTGPRTAVVGFGP